MGAMTKKETIRTPWLITLAGVLLVLGLVFSGRGQQWGLVLLVAAVGAIAVWWQRSRAVTRD